MVDTNKLILLIIEILVMLLVIVFTGMLCRNLNNNISSEVVSNNSIDIKVVKNNNNLLYPMTDSYASNNSDETILNISNYSNKGVKCRLLMMIKNEDNLDYNVLKVKIDDEIFNLNNKYIYEDENYLYFDLTHKQIDKQSNISFAMWLDENTKEFNNSVVYNFSVQKI